MENECYLMAENHAILTGKQIKSNRSPERYSVDYNKNYDQPKLVEYLEKIFLNDSTYKIPQYINSHTFSKTDSEGNHQTLYTRDKKDNPKFNGKTIKELLDSLDPMFVHDYDNKYIFDGDTIEFITQNFYKTTVDQCIKELIYYKKCFLDKINSFTNVHNLPKLYYPQVNYGLVQFKTNMNNVSTFNNGTYHFNFTLPTKLDENGKIADNLLFQKQHSNAIKLLQWIEPLIILFYGSPDVFSYDNDRYASGSLRLLSSRYIGVGTYDANEMKQGKLLNDSIDESRLYLREKSWYNQVYQKTDYLKGKFIGYDFNYGKHYHSGIEFRIFDYFPEDALTGLLNLIILLLDHSLKFEVKCSAFDIDDWHDFTADVLINGYTTIIPDNFAKLLHIYTNLPLIYQSDPTQYINTLISYLYSNYANGTISTLMSPAMSKPILHNVNGYMYDNNYLQYISVNNENDAKLLDLYQRYTCISDKKYQASNLSKLDNLLIKTNLHHTKNLDLDLFYEKLINVKHITLDNYLII